MILLVMTFLSSQFIEQIITFGFSKTSIVLSSAIEKRVPLGHIEGNGKV
jgi:Lrp/AsnC family leucine-responsive transcriptional regulator